MTDEPPIPLSLTDRWKAHTISQKTDLRAKLLDAVARHEGWEESAVAMVDEAIMPVLANHQATPDASLLETIGRTLFSSEPSDLGITKAFESVGNTHNGTPDLEGLIEKLKKEMISTSMHDDYDAGIESAIEIVKQHFGERP